MQKKSYLDFKNDPDIKTPMFSWLVNQTFFYVIIIVVALLSVLYIGKVGLDALNTSKNVQQKVSPYIKITAENSPGRSWADKFISQKPDNLTEWEVSKTTKPANIVSESSVSCVKINSESIPETLLSTHTASGNGVTSTVQVYGAGQAYSQYNVYANDLLSGCKVNASQSTVGNSKINLLKFDNGFIMTAGDAILSVVTSDSNKIDGLINYYENRFPDSLKSSKCININVSDSDDQRSFFYNSSNYTGLVKYKTVKSTVNTNDIPTTSITLNKLSSSVQKPDDPLPSGMASSLPSSVKEPSVPKSVQKPENFDTVVSYQVADINGPGCGWAWSSQVKPVYDTAELKTAKKNAISNGKQSSNSKAESYLSNSMNWSFSMMMLSSQADSWNYYVNQVNSIRQQWQDLNNARNKIKSAWYSYVNAHNAWASFDSNKEKAQEDYDNAVQKCTEANQELEEWESMYGDSSTSNSGTNSGSSTSSTTSPSPSASPSTTPSRPSGCTSTPTRPAILDQQKGAEPQAPSIPSNVTIPSNWIQLDTSNNN